MSLEAGFQSATRVSFGRDLHGFGEGAREIGVEVNDPPDIVVELSDETHIPGEIVWDLGLVVLVYLVYQQPVLVEYALDLDKVLLKCLQHFSIDLTTSIR